MDDYKRTYEHQGVLYERDGWTGITRVATPWTYPAGPSSVHEEYVPTPAEVARQASVKAKQETRESLMAKAREMAKTMVITETPEQWKVRKGYTWQAVGPSGKVYKEVIRKLTIESPEEFVEFHALELATMRSE